jgi:hypothetical protein
VNVEGAPRGAQDRPAVFVEHAYRYAQLGWALIRTEGKDPRGKRWEQTEPDAPDVAAGKWSQWGARYNLGIVCGTSGLAVLDVDRDDDAEQAAIELLGLDELPATPTVRTGRGSRLQLYFADPGGLKKRVRDGFELRVGEHQCIAPPSVHPETGRPYVWLPGRAPWEVAITPLPETLIRYFDAEERQNGAQPALVATRGETTAYGRKAAAEEALTVANAPDGTRNNTLNIAALKLGSLVAGGELDEQEARSSLQAAAALCGLPEHEAKATIESGFTAGLRQPRRRPATSSRPHPDTPPEPTRASESVESVTDSQGVSDGNGLTDSALEESVGPESVTPGGSEGARTDSDPESVTDFVRPFALPISEFIALDRPKAEPLLADVDGRAVVGRHSLTLLGALGGHGKTTFFVDLALHLVAGVDYPPFTVPAPVSILMIENEGPEELFAAKLKGRLASFPHELKARLDVCTIDWGGFSLASEPLLARLAHEIAEKGYDLVFGDPLDSLGIAGVGSPEDTRAFLVLMKETGLNKTVAWWLNTHPRKEETKEALNEISGAWGGKPDSVLLLRMLADDRTQIRFPKLRWTKRGKRPSILLAFDPDTEAFAYLGEESEEERDYLAEITALLGDGRWRIAKEIAATKANGGIGANVDTIKKVLEEHPDVFESRTGEAAQKVGRSALATVWQLRDADEDASSSADQPPIWDES